jgi:hypothetical protein
MSSVHLSRRALVASTAALPAAVALSLPAAADDKAAAVARAEQIVELLRTGYVAEGWQLDEQRAAHFLESMRGLDSGDGDTPEMRTVLKWTADHGQSLDWIFRGDLGVMICAAAAHSMPTPPDAYLFA